MAGSDPILGVCITPKSLRVLEVAPSMKAQAESITTSFCHILKINSARAFWQILPELSGYFCQKTQLRRSCQMDKMRRAQKFETGRQHRQIVLFGFGTKHRTSSCLNFNLALNSEEDFTSVPFTICIYSQMLLYVLMCSHSEFCQVLFPRAQIYR